MASFFFGLQRLSAPEPGGKSPLLQVSAAPLIRRRHLFRAGRPRGRFCRIWLGAFDRTAARSTHFRPAGLCEPRPDPILNSKDEAATREPATGHGDG